MDTTYGLIKRYNSLSALIWYVFMMILSIEGSITYTELQPEGVVARTILFIQIILFLMFIVLEKYSRKSLFIMAGLISVGLITYITTGFTLFLKSIMAAIVFQKMNYKKGFKVIFLSRFFLMLVINSLSLIGILDISARMVGKSYGQILGYGLGYSHPNRYAYSFIYLEMALFCWKNDKVKVGDYLFALLLGFLGYYITKSRTLLLITFILVILVTGYKQKRFTSFINWLINKTVVIIYPALIILSVVGPYIILAGQGVLFPILNALNQTMSSRFLIVPRVFEYYHLSLFGGVNDFTLLSQKYNYFTVDNGYINILFGYGIIGTLIFLLLFVVTNYKLLKGHEYVYAICSLVVAMWGLSENILINVSFNIAVFFWGVFFSKKQSYKDT